MENLPQTKKHKGQKHQQFNVILRNIGRNSSAIIAHQQFSSKLKKKQNIV